MKTKTNKVAKPQTDITPKNHSSTQPDGKPHQHPNIGGTKVIAEPPSISLVCLADGTKPTVEPDPIHNDQRPLIKLNPPHPAGVGLVLTRLHLALHSRQIARHWNKVSEQPLLVN